MTDIYLASSWRNPFQPDVLRRLRLAGHKVYDFRNPYDRWDAETPSDGSGGFRWSDIDPLWEGWSLWSYTQALQTDIAAQGFRNDWTAMGAAQVGVLLLPSGRSAHIEAGYFAGHPSKSLHILIAERQEPELMYRMADGIHTSVESLLEALSER